MFRIRKSAVAFLVVIEGIDGSGKGTRGSPVRTAVFFFLIAYAVTLFLLAALLFPDKLDEYRGYEDFFLTRRRWFFGVFALTFPWVLRVLTGFSAEFGMNHVPGCDLTGIDFAHMTEAIRSMLDPVRPDAPQDPSPPARRSDHLPAPA